MEFDFLSLRLQYHHLPRFWAENCSQAWDANTIVKSSFCIDEEKGYSFGDSNQVLASDEMERKESKQKRISVVFVWP